MSKEFTGIKLITEDLFTEPTNKSYKQEDESNLFYSHKSYLSTESDFTSPSIICTPIPKEYKVINLLNKGVLNIVGKVAYHEVYSKVNKNNTVGEFKKLGFLKEKFRTPVKKDCGLRTLFPEDEESTHCESDSELSIERKESFMDDSIENYIKEQLFIHKRHIDKLKQWIGLTKYRIIYNTEVDEFTTLAFNKKVDGRSNLAFVVLTSDKWVFGCFSQARIPKIKEKEESAGPEDKGFFIFSLKNPHHTTATKITPKVQSSRLVFYPKNSVQLFGVQNAFLISNHPNESFVFRNIDQHYSIPSLVGKELLTGNCYPEIFNTEKVLVIEWF
ncbi:hypothetical protein EHI8A_085640 [Entamoeba histolytica HM-1:IMSS-B]|uniref:TLDc domain-containing protein n=6 Tax=Entamoeba histolytica TaxID=5759 RepID=B1N4W5_ENTH1|nr:hypothetical protein EHI_094790 [Entamoeba histolytica HM-1:IMSS]EMD44511.1 Hypothetical protein EHI5A_122940 [Entamoeba histolytica KU27]EMH77336.1 hypothetical protein EHI8A_085640 [Entamoeba histolytica HM-1:IMSS-B]EMS12592.1 hypothetical protein KM1_153550 [Entamoeba histolytica HM-3:IMSS]ENY65905.1 hypothetical protein EHI7A_083850 [Entamoeba histolytica HM-1:IMSS-A]GAT98965.1 hypothetical protein CL6EHI_094790 [Entamoeba histolytica]|eukprot:XP_001914231.1 hypothetical protein EHI_094790 [Entamoeba histolytica HM-1:IMSS]